MTTSVAAHFTCRPTHGGNLEEVAAAYGIVPDELIDFSSNINPAGPPSGVLSRVALLANDPRVLAHYPEPDCSGLRNAIAIHINVEPNCIVVANGSAAMLDVVLRAIRPKRCLLPIPTFSEYERALNAAEVDCVFFNLDPENNFALGLDDFSRMSTTRECDFWLVSNPHNPSGSALGKQALAELAERARIRNVTLLIDEAFVDFCPELSVSSLAVSSPNLVVLRSMTKFYGMAGLRVGFAVTNPVYAGLLSLQVPSWPICKLAITAAIEALSDAGYSQQTLSSCRRERSWLSSQLEMLGLRVFPSVANFLLVRLPPGARPATSVRELLITQHKIVIRDCSSYQGLEGANYFRVAVLDRNANEKLIRALKEVLTS